MQTRVPAVMVAALLVSLPVQAQTPDGWRFQR